MEYRILENVFKYLMRKLILDCLSEAYTFKKVKDFYNEQNKVLRN